MLQDLLNASIANRVTRDVYEAQQENNRECLKAIARDIMDMFK